MAFLSTFPVVCMCILTIKEIKMNKLNVKLVLKLKEAGPETAPKIGLVAHFNLSLVARFNFGLSARFNFGLIA